jgi:hypothetical protein
MLTRNWHCSLAFRSITDEENMFDKIDTRSKKLLKIPRNKIEYKYFCESLEQSTPLRYLWVAHQI